MSTIIVRLLGAALLLTLSPAWTLHAQELDWAQKMFEKQQHDFGVVARGADVRYQLKITNIYKQTVHISDVRTTCGCAAADPSATTLASRETAYVEITMNTTRFSRQKDSNVIVTFDQPLFAEVRIPVSAYIRTDVVLTPGGANFGGTDVGEDASRTINIAYAGRDDWNIKGVKVDNPHINAEVKETSRSGGRVGYQLHLTLKKSAPLGKLREQIMLVSDDAARPHIPVLVEARVEADITVIPPVVSLGMMTPGKPRTVNLVIKGRKPFEVSKIECDSDRDCFKVRLPESARVVHVLPLTINPPNEPGEFTEEFTVTIAGREEPLHFKAYGRITN